MGVRPNSPPQTTSVSSSMPRCFRSRISAAIGLIDFAGHFESVAHAAMMVPIAMIELDEANASLRQPPGQQAIGGEGAVAPPSSPYMLRMCRGSLARSHQDGNAVCMRKAISYWAMRVAISGSSSTLFCSRLSPCTAEMMSPRSARDAGRIAQVQHRIADAAQLHTLKPAGQKAAVP